MTSYLIEHEIRQGDTIEDPTNFAYKESHIKDLDTHNNYISKIYYVKELDKVLMFEQNMRILKIYEGDHMKLVYEINCSANILALEYIPDRAMIAISLSDQSIVFYENAVI